MDDVIIAAALGTALLVKLVQQQAAAQTAIAAGGAGLNIAKLRTAKQTFDLGDVDPSIPRHIVVGPEQITNLLSTTEVTSSDFNTVKALVQGEIDSFYGFQISLYLIDLLITGADRHSMYSLRTRWYFTWCW